MAYVDCLSRNMRQDDIQEEPLAEKYITELPYEEDGVIWTQEPEGKWIDWKPSIMLRRNPDKVAWLSEEPVTKIWWEEL